MTALAKHKYSLEEYFEIERESEEKFEYWDGDVQSASGASQIHERIVVNVGAELRGKLRGKKYSVFGSKLKVKVPVYSPYRYPDLSVYCGEGIYEKTGGFEVLTNPQMLIEVLSPSTEGFDRGEKFTYLQINRKFYGIYFNRRQSPARYAVYQT